MKAIAVLNAAYNTFSRYGSYAYSKAKTFCFMHRCGNVSIDMEDLISQEIPLESVKDAVFAMLESNSERVFWEYLETEVKQSVFDAGCLADIQDFINKLMLERKEGKA